MMNILENVVVKRELERLSRLIGTDKGRSVEMDIKVFNNNLLLIEDWLNKGENKGVIIDNVICRECILSLHTILEYLGLKRDLDKNNIEGSKLYISKKFTMDYLDKLVKLNVERNHDEMAETVVKLQHHLVRAEYLTEDLVPTNTSDISVLDKQIVDIFLDVRREYQEDGEVCQDFSYLSVAWYWLESNGTKIY